MATSSRSRALSVAHLAGFPPQKTPYARCRTLRPANRQDPFFLCVSASLWLRRDCGSRGRLRHDFFDVDRKVTAMPPDGKGHAMPLGRPELRELPRRGIVVEL